MKTNIGYVDRGIRVVVGLVILAVGFEAKSEWGMVGFIPLLTAYAGFCPIYHLLHISTSHPLNG